MRNLSSSRTDVSIARNKWIQTMTRVYPDFNAKLWDKYSSYKDKWPQPKIS